MSILNNETNDRIINAMENIALYIASNIENEDVNISKTLLNTIGKDLSDGILNRYYKHILEDKLRDNTNLKGLIVPKPNSWMSTIDLNADLDGLTKYNLIPADNEVMSKLIKRFSNELSLYKNQYSRNAKMFATKINNYLKTNRQPDELIDNIIINKFERTSLFDVIKDKGWLEGRLLVDTPNNSEPIPTELSNFSLDNIESDLEVAMLVKEELLKSRDYSNIRELIFLVLNAPVVSQAVSAMYKTTVLDINAIIGLIIVLKEATTKQNNLIYHYLLNKAIDLLKTYNDSYERFLRVGAVIVGIKVLDLYKLEIFVLSENFDKYMDNNGSVKALIGSAFNKKAINNLQIKPITNIVLISIEELVSNKDEYLALSNSIQQAMILNNRNNSHRRMVNLYMLTIEEIIGTSAYNKYAKVIEEYVDNLPISKIGNVEEVCINLIGITIASETNFMFLISKMREARDVLKDPSDKSIVTTYALLSYILTYLAVQTEVV